MPSMLRALFFSLLIFAGVIANTAQADPHSKSFSHWRITTDNTITMTFTIASREATRLPDYQFNANLADVFATHLTDNVSVANDQQACHTAEAKIQRSKPGYLQYALQFNCARPLNEVAIVITPLMEVAPGHVHFARFSIIEQPIFEQLFTRRQIQHTLQLQTQPEQASNHRSNGETLLTYTLLGFEHILIGADHIAFLLTLMLLANRLRMIILIVTGFTLGHSITLSLATLGMVTPNSMVVEAMIGFTVALVAIENISAQTNNANTIAAIAAGCLGLLTLITAFTGSGPPLISMAGMTVFTLCYLRLSNSPARAQAMRPAVTASFGLIHGFGFASVLMEVGLPEQRILPALFGFNIGVELGQIAIVIGLAAIAWLFRKTGKHKQALINECLCAGLCGIGVFWFIQRAYF